jgi:DNA helicase-2/ATP-dependent DNA helicase PcrA
MNYFDAYPDKQAILIEGVAGGGKSTLVAEHAADCIRIHARTLLITFSQSGKDVLDSYMAQRGIHPETHKASLSIHTIDGLALMILERWGDRRHVLKKDYIVRNLLPDVLDAAAPRIEYIEAAIPGKHPQDLNALMRDIDFYRASGAYRLEYEEDREMACEGNLNFALPIVQTVFALYEDLRLRWIPDETTDWISGLENRKHFRNKETVGFRTVSEAVTDIFEHPRHIDRPDSVSRLFNYKYTLIDEFHDTTPLQLEFLCEVCKNSIRVMAVGDKHQNIYGWRGADPDVVFARYRDYFSPAVVPLKQSYRFGAKLANALGRLTRSDWQSLASHRTTINHSTAAIDVLLEKLHDKQMLADTAIICRDNSDLAEVGFKCFDTLQNMGAALSFDLRTTFACRIVSFLVALAMPDARWSEHELRESAREFMALPHCLLDEQAREEILGGVITANNLKMYTEIQLKVEHKFYTDKMKDALRHWLTEAPQQPSFVEALRQFQDRADLLQSASGVARHYVASRGMIRSWHALLLYLESRQTPLDQWPDILRRLGAMRNERRAIQLLSVEDAKGREFDHVVVYGLNESVFPARGEDPVLERNRFYVAASRARKTLILAADGEPGRFFTAWQAAT